MQDVTVTLYPGYRHEMLNEPCKAQVYDDVRLGWKQDSKMYGLLDRMHGKLKSSQMERMTFGCGILFSMCGDHVEVYDGCGVFLFSADSTAEAYEMLEDSAWQISD